MSPAHEASLVLFAETRNTMIPKSVQCTPSATNLYVLLLALCKPFQDPSMRAPTKGTWAGLGGGSASDTGG